MKGLIQIGFMLLLSACAYTPTNFKEQTTPSYPLLFSEMTTNDEIKVVSQWWQAFDSAELNRMMVRLKESNLSVDAAKLRLQRARLLVTQSEADNIPGVSTSANGRSSEDLDTGKTQNSSSGGLSLSYDIDIWGSREARLLSTRLDIDVQSYANRSTLLQVQGLLASEYFNLLSLRRRLTIGEKNERAAQRLLELVTLRYEAGDASGVEVSQQRNTLISAQRELLRLKNQATLSERAIGVLLGDTQLPAVSTHHLLQALALPNITLKQPAKVLRQRPDVQAADVALRQADIAVYQASIQGLPGLGLSANVTISDLLDLATGWTLGAALNSSAILFDGGRINAAQDIAGIDVELALNNYRAVTLTASQEILDSLAIYSYQKAAYLYDVTSLENNERLYRLAEIRYKAGDTDFLNLLSAQRSWFSAQLAVVSSYEQALNAALSVYRAVGGAPVLAG